MKQLYFPAVLPAEQPIQTDSRGQRNRRQGEQALYLGREVRAHEEKKPGPGKAQGEIQS